MLKGIYVPMLKGILSYKMLDNILKLDCSKEIKLKESLNPIQFEVARHITNST
jgi:hypothetical protein